MLGARTLLLVVVLAVVGSVSASNLEDMKARFEGWKKCHPGFHGLTAAQMENFKKCDDMNIPDHLCYLACVRAENKLVTKDGMWDDAKGYKSMAKMWDKTPAAQEASDKWYHDTRACISEFEKTNKWPMVYTGTCPEMETLAKCVRASRDCM